jgi:hypothetical protein
MFKTIGGNTFTFVGNGFEDGAMILKIAVDKKGCGLKRQRTRSILGLIVPDLPQ